MTVNFTFWLILALSMSVVANILMFWYIRKALERLFITSDNIADLIDLLTSYSTHLKSIHQLENFYGDAELKNLVAHTDELINTIEEEYSDVLYITNIVEYDEKEEGEQELNEEKKVSEENVFYAGTRKSDT